VGVTVDIEYINTVNLFEESELLGLCRCPFNHDR